MLPSAHRVRRWGVVRRVSRQSERRDRSSRARAAAGSRRAARWAVFALVLVAAALRFYRLGAQSYWIDEVLTVRAANLGEPFGLRDFVGNIQGPLHALLIHLVGTFSAREVALRSISAVAGVACVPLLYLLGSEVVSRRAGLVAALLGALSPFAVWYSQEARNYSLLIFFSTLSSLLVYRLVRRDGRVWPVYVVSVALACYLNLSGFFLAVAHNVFAGPRLLRDRRFAAKWLGSQAVLLVLLVPALVGLAHWTGKDSVAERVVVATPARTEHLLRGATTFTPMAVPYALYVLSYGNSLGPSMEELHAGSPASAFAAHLSVVLPACLSIGCALLLGLRGIADDRGAMRLVLAVALVPLAGALALALLNVKPFNPRYVAVTFPMFLMLVAAGVGHLKRTSGTVLVGIVLVFFAASLANYYTKPQYWKEDVRGAAQYVQAHEKPGDKVLVPVVLDVFDFYFRGSAERIVIYRGHATSEAQVEEELAPALGSAKRLWFVDSRLWFADPDRRIPGYLERNYRRVDEHGFPGVRVSLFELDRTGPVK
jgi:4-amino-4-deoxy-L-arabinose transferase-like glycosyltransferase